MRFGLLLTLVACVQFTPYGVAAAQSPGPRQDRVITFASWGPATPAAQNTSARTYGSDALRSHRTRRILIGGAVGATAGLAACTAISTLADDSADGGLSFCPLDTYLLVGGAGFLGGAAVGWLF
jgi:hypothetical protein